MNSVIHRISSAIARRFAPLFLALASVPAFASGSEANVKLVFTAEDKNYLYISLALAIISIVVGFLIRSWVLKQSPGNEKMQEVGAAIRAGALAYLRQQVTTMSFFVVAIAIGLFFLYKTPYSGLSVFGLPLALWIGVTFILGVLASYIAGYVGMVMAVAANMRVASAAQTSYKNALEVAFRAGAVAGLVTVGMGLLGATGIFLLAGEHSMKLLIGFGFGGSLAALFMRVGGGIFTKAADVGADLVGKVEAGIPEDDARNPATIADNVGDNVGDCAGMAADIFESYEVTLVAAIILGAATASIFDQPTWMRLILFALMARGVGIIASILGIFLVKGRNDEKMDPLKPITKGFWISAGVAALATFGLAWYMMGNINAITWSQQDGTKVAGITPITMGDMRWMHAINQVEDGIETPGGPPPATKPASISTAELTTKANAFMQNIVAQINRNLPPESPKQVAPKPITEAQAIAYRDNPLGDYTIVQNGQSGGSFVGISAQSLDNSLYLAHVEQTFTGPDGKPQGEPMKRWQIVPESIVNEPPKELKILKKMEVPFGISRDGDLYWAVSEKVEDKAAFEALVPVGYSKTEIAAPTNPMEPAMAKEDGTIAGAMKQTKQVEWWRFAVAILFGIVMAWVIERLTDYFVSFEKKPVREIAMASTAGPAPMIIQGFAYAMESAVWSVLTIVLALLGPLFIFPPADFGGYILSFYGIALVGLGLLTTTGYILAMDTFGPISDNAQGVYEMSGAKETETTMEGSMPGSRAVQRLDAAGNTTKALTKGFAIATAVVAAVALFHSFIEDARLTEAGLPLQVPQIFIGLLIGGAVPFLFSAFSINAVGRAAFLLIGEVRRQFAADPGIMAGTTKPDYGRCVAIVTSAAQKELLGPGILAIAFPVLVGFGLAIGGETTMIGGVEYNLVGAQALGGFLAGAILSGQLLAVTLANSGGAWDNSKKLIEDGMYGGKGSEAHKAGIVVDTVGDPFKDTAGPALNPLIKVMNLVALLVAGLVIAPMAEWVRFVIVGVSVLALAIAVFWSKRGSMGAELAKTVGEG
ncbi:MAG: sodium/proton-translocating pyrophosphatase [Armatimonadota bacterium]|nr:sodium/proton-translocating pyrophosphatase [Armatimonadota bacterium]